VTWRLVRARKLIHQVNKMEEGNGKSPRTLQSLIALLAAEIISVTGSQMTRLALPWFVLVTTHSPARMSIVLGVEMVAMALFGVPGGNLSARLGARRTMILANLICGILIAMIPVLHEVGILSFPLLLVLVFAVGAPFTPYQTAQVVILPELVGSDKRLLTRANSLLLGANRITLLLGAPVAGVAIGLIGATAVLWVDAATFVVAFVLIGLFVKPREATSRAPDGKSVFGGVRILWNDSLLKTWTITISGFEFAWQVVFAAIPILAYLRYDHNPRIAGVLLAAFGGGALAGNLFVLPLVANVAPMQIAVTGKVVQSLAFWVLVFNVEPVTFGVVLAITGACTGLIGGPSTAVQISRIPEEWRSRTMAAFLTITLTAGSLGLVAAGPVIETLGVPVVFLAIALLHTVGGFYFSVTALKEGKLPSAATTLQEKA
jgi:MFS family permease